MTDRILDGLFLITDMLLPPVLVLLVVLSATTLWMLGTLAREAWDRGRTRTGWRRFLDGLETDRVDIGEFAGLKLSGYPARFQRSAFKPALSGDATGPRKCLDDLELDMARLLSRLTFATRIGPMIGLVGTLLPLGPALRGLASEDLSSTAANLEVAFTSTVFGLLIGGLAYGAGILRRNWYDQDLSDLGYLLDLRRSSAVSVESEGPSEGPSHA